MNELILSEALNLVREDFILDAFPPSWHGEKQKRRPLAIFGRLMSNGWAAAVLSGVVAIGVLTAIVLAGRSGPHAPPAGPVGSLTESESVTETQPTTDTEPPEETTAYDPAQDPAIAGLDMSIPDGATLLDVGYHVDPYGMVIRAKSLELPAEEGRLHDRAIELDVIDPEKAEIHSSLLLEGYVTLFCGDGYTMLALQYIPQEVNYEFFVEVRLNHVFTASLPNEEAGKWYFDISALITPECMIRPGSEGYMEYEYQLYLEVARSQIQKMGRSPAVLASTNAYLDEILAEQSSLPRALTSFWKRYPWQDIYFTFHG